mmetsp:Transcript_23375/g.51911  ORF Transcript_23375/g.51911 Transcript_23375/m.51911 type:complete len:209 (+) Transcript_23375:58-684(+)
MLCSLSTPAYALKILILLVFLRHLVLDQALQLHTHLGGVVPLQRVFEEATHHLQLHHLQGALDHPAQDVAVLQVLVLRGQLHEVDERVVVEDQAERRVLLVPVRNGGDNAQEHLEGHLRNDVCGLLEVGAVGDSALRKELVHQSDADVVAHFLQLLVHLIDIFNVFDELHDQRSVRQREKLRVHFGHLVPYLLPQSQIVLVGHLLAAL